MFYYSMNRPTTTHATPNTTVNVLRITTGLNAARIMAIYGSCRGTSAGGGQVLAHDA